MKAGETYELEGYDKKVEITDLVVTYGVTDVEYKIMPSEVPMRLPKSVFEMVYRIIS